MSRIYRHLAVATLAAGLTCGMAVAQNKAPTSAGTSPAASEPTTATKVENWTEKQWDAAKQKWSQDQARWNACNQDAKAQKLSGRKSWSFLYDCMTKV